MIKYELIINSKEIFELDEQELSKFFKKNKIEFLKSINVNSEIHIMTKDNENAFVKKIEVNNAISK